MFNALNNSKQHAVAGIKSKHRLAEISHHFLSDENERSPAWKNTSIIPIILGSRHDDYIVYELDRSFNQQNKSSMVLNVENRFATSGMSPTFPEGIPTTTASETTSQESELPDLCLVPVTSPSTTLALQSDRFIIAVHTSLGGVRIAYDQLAFMASLDTDFTVCVVMLDARTTQEAKRFFGFLCDSAKSLLALKLECGGYLLRDSHSHSANDSSVNDSSVNDSSVNNNATNANGTDDVVATDLEGVAKEVLRKFAPSLQRAAITHLSAPAGPAGLLS
jgi:hypothetical protein